MCNKKEIPSCRSCGSKNILKDANAEWDPETGTWVLAAVYDNASCEDCGETGNHQILWVKAVTS